MHNFTSPAHVPASTPTPARIPLQNADLICAWANGFRVQFRYLGFVGLDGTNSTLIDPNWYICGPWYANFGNNQHRIHPDDEKEWKEFKSYPRQHGLDAGVYYERQRNIAYIRELARTIPAHRTAYMALADRIANIKDV